MLASQFAPGLKCFLSMCFHIIVTLINFIPPSSFLSRKERQEIKTFTLFHFDVSAITSSNTVVYKVKKSSSVFSTSLQELRAIGEINNTESTFVCIWVCVCLFQFVSNVSDANIFLMCVLIRDSLQEMDWRRHHGCPVSNTYKRATLFQYDYTHTEVSLHVFCIGCGLSFN